MYDFLSMANATFSFNVTMLLCILLVTFSITRWGLFAIGKARSLINPAYIKIVHRDESGQIVAELNQDGYDSIPISHKYQDEITKLL